VTYKCFGICDDFLWNIAYACTTAEYAFQRCLFLYDVVLSLDDLLSEVIDYRPYTIDTLRV
jgi:hypothetical protein